MDLNRIYHDDGCRATLRLEALELLHKGVITANEALGQQLAALEQVASTGLWVMITGESGTQKQRWAEHLHQVSGSEGAYVRFDCAATPAARFETALFGDPVRSVQPLYLAVKGAFPQKKLKHSRKTALFQYTLIPIYYEQKRQPSMAWLFCKIY